MKKQLRYLTLFLVFASGCLAPKDGGVTVEHGRLLVEDRGFASRIEVVRDQVTKTGSGFLKAQVTLRNTSKRDFTCQYQFSWKDKNGMELKSAAPLWTPLPLHGREEAVIEGTCPVPKAVDYRLVLRPLPPPR